MFKQQSRSGGLAEVPDNALQPIARCLLRIAHCVLRIAHCLLRIVYSLFPDLLLHGRITLGGD